MSCSRSQQALPRWQDVTINGSWADGDDHTGENFNAYTDGFQAGKVLTWDSVVPDEDGLVTLTFSTGTNEFGYLNAMVITLVPEPSTALLLVFGGVSLAMRRRRRKPHLRPGISHGGNMHAGCDPITLTQAEHDRRGFAMLSRTLLISFVVVVAMAVPVADAADYSITTLYNHTSYTGGNMFDVTTFDNPVRITSLDINSYDPYTNGTLRVYTRTGTYAGHETSAEGWTLHSVVPGIAAQPRSTPTPVDIRDLYLPAGTTTGLYVTYESGYLSYTNTPATTYGGPAEQLQLDLGVAVSYPFNERYYPRIWNGTVYYDVLDAIPDPQPQILIHGGNGVVFGPDSKWNTIHAGLAGVPVAMHDPAGVPTGVTATLSQWTNSSTIGQTGEYANTHPVLAEATGDYMFVTGVGNTGTLTLEGLADTWYRVEMSASRNLSASSVGQNTTLNGAWADGDHNGQGFNARTDGFDKGTVLLWRARPVDGVLTLEVSRQNPDAYLNALIVTQLPSEPQPQIFIDAGNTKVFGVEDKWNTIHADMSGPIALYDPAGVPTGATVTLAGQWRNGDVDDCIGAFAGTILGEATDDFIWIHSSQPAGVGATLTFEGLEPESWQWYRFEMSASRSNDAYTRRQDVTLNGEWPDGPDHNGLNFDAYNDGFLAGSVLSWDHVRPDENGLITLTITRKNGDAYLNALVITLVPEPSAGVLLTLAGLSVALRRRRRSHLGPDN
ncbi:MAG: PEP-CTERM sorting domain-containing protein [Thermoguttaceae bacterium]|nr:PEP-CTERM sorting domain-containing protein [Thermoguttaceae bacterium]